MKTPVVLRFLLTYCIIICGINICLAQKYSPKYLREDDKEFRQLTSYTSENGWIEFSQDKNAESIDSESFFKRFGKNLGLSEGYQMRLTQDETDPKETRHQRFKLYYKNIPVEGAEFTLHSRKGRLTVANGRIVEDLTIDVSKPMPENQALEKALADRKLTVSDFKGDNKLPKGELLLTSVDGDFVSSSYRFAYAFDVYGKARTIRFAYMLMLYQAKLLNGPV